MRTAQVDVPIADELWFGTLMAQNQWPYTWITETKPDFEEDPE